MPQTIWTVAEVTAHLSEVLDQACSQGPQTIVREGSIAAVLVSVEEWERRTSSGTRIGNLAEFFAASPLRGSGLELKRLDDGPRPGSL